MADSIPDDVMDALIDNTRVMDANVSLLKKAADKADKKETKDKNLVSKAKEVSSLSSSEKLRYQEIGKELFKPFIVALEQMLIKEKRSKAMLVGNEAKTIKKAAEKQKKENNTGKKETSWWEILVQVGLIGMMVFIAFRDKIETFFSKFGENMKNVFKGIWDFVDITNPKSGLMRIVNTIGGFFTSVWSSIWGWIKPAFAKLGSLGSDLWGWITQKWEDCVTGPNGILSAIPQSFNAVKNWVSDGASFVGDLVMSSIVDPIKNLFSSTSEDAKKSAKNKEEEYSKKANEHLENADKRTNEAAENINNNVKNLNKEYKSLAPIVTKYVGGDREKEEIAKSNIARESLNAFLKKNNIVFDPEEDKSKYEEIFKKHITMQNGQAVINMQKVAEELQKQAKADSSIWADESEAIETLRSMELSQLEEINADVQRAMEKNLTDLGAQVIKENEVRKLEEEKLKNAIPPEHKEFVAAQNLIIQSVGSLQSSMAEFDNTLFQTFKTIFEGFAEKFFKLLSIDVAITTPKHEEQRHYAYNNTANDTTNYNLTLENESPTVINILPIKKEAFTIMNQQISELVKETVKIINSQNSILEDIKLIISSNTQATERSTQIIAANTAAKDSDGGSTAMSRTSKNLINDFWHVSSPY